MTPRLPLRPAVLAFVLLALWELGGRLYDVPLLLPWPSRIVMISLPSLAVFGGSPLPNWTGALSAVTLNLAITVWRMVIGLALGATSGILVGIAAFLISRRCGSEPIVLVLLRSLPLFGLVPLFVLWFGGRESGVWLYIAFSSAAVVATGVQQAIGNVPKALLMQSHLLGATRIQSFITVSLPAIVPELKGTIRNVLGLAWAFSLGAEFAGAGDGLGHLVYLSYLYADMGKIAALAGIYCLSGLVVFWAFAHWTDDFASWSQNRFSGA